MSDPQRRARRRRFIRVFRLLGVAVIVLALIALNLTAGLDVQRQLNRLGTASTEATLWSMTQTETEAARLETAVLTAMGSQNPDLDALRIRFDLLYSRIRVLDRGDGHAWLRDDLKSAPRLQRLSRYLDRWLPVIDGADSDLQNRLPALARDTAELRRTAHDLAVLGIGYSNEISALRRQSIFNTLLRIAWQTAALVAGLVAVLIWALHLLRIREEKSAQNREIRQRMEATIATSLDAVILTDRHGRILEYNGAAKKTFGYDRQTALNADLARLVVPAALRGAGDTDLSRFMRDETAAPGPAIMQAMRADGRAVPVEISRATIERPEGRLYLAFIRDITNRVAAETELRDARDRAISGERSKAQLLAVMSHEMRTPLNGILGTLDLLGDTGLSPEQTRNLAIMRGSANLLLDQVNDVLDISRLDAGKMQVDKREFDLIALCQEVIDSQSAAALAQRNRLTLTPPHPDLHRAFSDPERLRQVLLNLVSNALKFTEDGQVTVETECLDGRNQVEIRVIDSGIGISETDLDRIFGDFVTLDSSYQRRSMGTGLGLGICRRLVAALGGEMGAESEPGLGSVFWLRLPLSPEDQASPAPRTDKAAPPDAPPPPLDILIVEDNPTNRLILIQYLERDGHRVSEAHTGGEAISMAAQRRYDVILMDISMPGMDGIQATGQIRAGQTGPGGTANSGLNRDTPIVATTAHAQPEDLQAFAEAGMVTTLVKPFTRRELRACLARHAAPAPRAPRSSGPARPALSPNIVPDTVPDTDAAPDPAQTAPPNVLPPLIDPDHLHSLQGELSDAQLRRALASFQAEITDFLTRLHGNTKPAVSPDTIPASNRPAPASIAAEAHRLAGSSGVFGALRLAGRLHEIEARAGAGQLDDLTDLTHRLHATWRDTHEAMTAANLPLPAAP